MQTVRDLESLRGAVAALREGGRRVALVPTMGALHAGHMALVAQARAHADAVVVSIFVNPMQFGANEDLDRYPRQEAADAALLAEHGVDLLWAPDVAVMYPAGFSTEVSVSGVSEAWDGAARPGHFTGVATVVLKLLNQIAPDVALFGEKDLQQLAVIRRVVRDLDLPVEIVGVATQREADGLARSSRNAYLSANERAAAHALPDALADAAEAIAGGAPVADSLARAGQRLIDAGFAPADYLALVDPATMAPVDAAPGRLIVAAKLGRTRLIDNLAVSRG